MTDQPKENTDRELWRDDWQGTLFVTAKGGIGINVGGHVIVKPLRAWHEALALAAERSGEDGAREFKPEPGWLAKGGMMGPGINKAAIKAVAEELGNE